MSKRNKRTDRRTNNQPYKSTNKRKSRCRNKQAIKRINQQINIQRSTKIVFQIGIQTKKRSKNVQTNKPANIQSKKCTKI